MEPTSQDLIPAQAEKFELHFEDQVLHCYRSTIGFATHKVEVYRAGQLVGQGHFNLDTLAALVDGLDIKLVSVDGVRVGEDGEPVEHDESTRPEHLRITPDDAKPAPKPTII